jgi:hypothetical protein
MCYVVAACSYLPQFLETAPLRIPKKHGDAVNPWPPWFGVTHVQILLPLRRRRLCVKPTGATDYLQ